MTERNTHAECVTAVAAFVLAIWLGNPWVTAAFLAAGLIVCGWTSAARTWLLILAALCGAFLVSSWMTGREGASQRHYLELIERLETVGESVAREFREGEQVPTAEVFRRLEEWSEDSGAQDLTIILFDSRGRSYAWSGPGLQHSLGPAVPPLGLSSRSSFTATSLFAVVPTPADLESSGGRVLVGRSFSTLSEPFAANGAFRGQRAMWTLIGGGSETTTAESLPGWQDFTPPDAPSLRIRRGAEPDSAGLRSAFACLAVGFGVLLASRLLTGGPGSWATVLLFGVACLAPLDLSPKHGLWGLLALLLVWFGWKSPGMVVSHSGLRGVLGGASVCLILALAWSHVLPGEELRWEAVPLGLTVSGVLLLLGLLGALRRSVPIRSAPLPWLALGFLGLALLFFEVPLVVACCCVLSGVGLGVWAGGGRKFGELCGFAVLCVLLGATVVEWAWLDTQRARADQRLDIMAPPTESGLDANRAGIREFFDGFDLRDFALAEPADLVPQDLAYALWSVSPMSVLDAYSAVLVTTPTGTSSFSFGLPLDPAQGDLDPVSVRWPSIAELPWLDQALVTDLVPVYSGELAWGDVEYWFASAPNRLHAGSVDLTLLGGNVGQSGAARASLTLGPAGALHSASDLGELGEWSRGQRAESEEDIWSKSRLILFPEPVLVTAERPAVGVTEAARRVGRRAGVVLASIGAFGGLILLVGLARPSVRRALRRWLGPYSKRMVVVFSLLVILPLSTMNLLLLQSVGNRLERERLTRGEAALTSAQIVLSDLLINDEPGFSLDSYIDDELLLWLARVVQHEVSLYFRGSVMASSRPELFAANLLPARIPGEVFSRISLEGERVASRESRVGGVSYRELYGSLDLPGVEPGASEVILSVPLLAQQEQATAELRQLATQSLLASAFLLSLVTVVGAALARRFTRPITEMAKGTERIAEGATTMGLDPAEPELAALAQAIDRMALRIAKGREELLREKRVVEGMVENITSAVVSVGGDGRILLLNRAAVDLFGASVGDELSSLLQRGFPSEFEELVSQRPEELRRSTASFVQEDEEHDWTIVWVPVPGTGDPEALLVVEEVSDVLKGQRLAAWAEMARMIAHEIKNPLTPIRLSAEHLHRVWRTRPEEVGAVLERCLGNILEQVDVLQQTASDFSVYSRIPQALFEIQDLVAATREVVEAYQLSCPPGIDVLFDSSVPELQARFDVKLLSRGIRNLVENAVKASEGGGKVEVLIRDEESRVSIEVLDRGPGVPPEDLRRIFEPYFSTSTGGTGLGLPIVREAVEQHGGEVTATNRDRGLRVVIELPRGPGSLLGDV